MVLPLVVLACVSGPEAWGRETLASIRKHYYIPESRLYAERSDRKKPAFNWGVGVVLSALNAAARLDDKFKPWLREFADASRVYWNKGGYDVLPAPKPFDRYYDDNAWMAIALVETFEVLGDKKYLDWAKGALEFSLSGVSPKGGVFWRESDKASRNTCSCAPTAFACLAVARHTNNEGLRQVAESIMAWTLAHLQDPDDGLMWDAIGQDGKVDKTKWTYNAALTIRTLHAMGKDVKPLVAASKVRWLKECRIDDPGRFSHLLVEAWIETEGVRPETVAALKAVYDSRDDLGSVPAHWGQTVVPDNPEILDQAAFVRACLLAALQTNS